MWKRTLISGINNVFKSSKINLKIIIESKLIENNDNKYQLSNNISKYQTKLILEKESDRNINNRKF